MADAKHVAALEAAEREALAALPADLATLAQGDPARWYALRAAQEADRVESAEFKDELKALRLSAIASDERQRLGHPGRGRPPLSAERKEFRQAQQDADEAPDRAELALKTYLNRIGQLKDAAPEIAQLDDQADAQQVLCEKVLEHLTAAAVAYREASEIADQGHAVMQRHADLVTFAMNPFIRLDEHSQFLDAILKRVAMRLATEQERVGGDADTEIAELRAKHETAKYKTALDAGATAFRTTPGGKGLWKAYGVAMREHEANAAEAPAGFDPTYDRQRLQTMLNKFYDAAAAHVGLKPQPKLYPQLG